MKHALWGLLILLLPSAVAAEQSDWTSIYTGIFAGPSRSSGTSTFQTAWQNSTYDFSSPTTGSVGVVVGANYQIVGTPLVVGVSGGINHPFLNAKAMFDVSIPNQYNALGRVGYSFGQTLLYGTAGGSWRRYRFQVWSVSTGGAVNVLQDDTHTAYSSIIGAGVEVKINSRWSTALEYRYIRGRTDNDLVFGGNVINDTRTSAIRIGLNYNWLPIR